MRLSDSNNTIRNTMPLSYFGNTRLLLVGLVVQLVVLWLPLPDAAVIAFSLHPVTTVRLPIPMKTKTSSRRRRSSSSTLSSSTLSPTTTTTRVIASTPPPALHVSQTTPFNGDSRNSSSSSSRSSRVQRENGDDDDDDDDDRSENDATTFRGKGEAKPSVLRTAETESLNSSSLNNDDELRSSSSSSTAVTTVIMPTTATNNARTTAAALASNSRSSSTVNVTVAQQQQPPPPQQQPPAEQEQQRQQSSSSSSISSSSSSPICRVVALSDGQIPATPQSLHPTVSDMLFASPHFVWRKLDDIYHAMSHEETRRLRYIMDQQRKEHEENHVSVSTSSSSSSSLQAAISLNGNDGEKTSISSISSPSSRSVTSVSAPSSSTSSSSSFDAQEEQKLVSVVRTCLEDAGFELLTQRDLDLCNALNAGYLLRLSILPDVAQLNPGILQEFYPEYCALKDKNQTESPFLFQGKVLVYWRGYSKEVSRGRLLLPKIDYLQASLVQQSAAYLQEKLTRTEQGIAKRLRRLVRSTTATSLRTGRTMVDRVGILRSRQNLRKALRASLKQLLVSPSRHDRAFHQDGVSTTSPGGGASQYMSASASPTSTFFKLARYGSDGSKFRSLGDLSSGADGIIMEDALKPFLICDDVISSGDCPAFLCDDDDGKVGGVASFDDAMYNCLNHGNLQCRYDRERLQTTAVKKWNSIMMENTQQQQQQQRQQLPPMQLLERVSIRNLVNVFSRDGRRNLFRTLFSKSELVEPTYREVVVVWRPLPPRRHDTTIRSAANQWVQNMLKIKSPPKWMYEMADMFDIQGLPSETSETPPTKKPDSQPLELRTFDDVPMSNIAAVLPKTKLVFRPADAFVFDFVSIASLVLLIGSQRFDSPRLDLLAIVSVSLWVVRLIIRYSNKLARYDLLVKTFLTSKISHRNAGALKYLATEAGSQRATRAGLVYAWLSGRSSRSINPQMQKQQQDDVPSSSPLSSSLSTCMGMDRQELLRDGPMELNDLVYGKQVRIDVDAALNDLEDLNLITTTTTVATNGSEQHQQLQVVAVVRDADTIVDRLQHSWNRIFEGKLGLNVVIGRRRDHGDGESMKSGSPEL